MNGSILACEVCSPKAPATYLVKAQAGAGECHVGGLNFSGLRCCRMRSQRRLALRVLLEASAVAGVPVLGEIWPRMGANTRLIKCDSGLPQQDPVAAGGVDSPSRGVLLPCRKVETATDRSLREISELFFLLCPVGGPVYALVQEWDFGLAYGFPPFGILARVARKIAVSKGRYIIIAPLWPKQAWFSLLWALSLEPAQLLLGRPDLLQQQGIHHPQPEMLKLVGWILNGGF